MSEAPRWRLEAMGAARLVGPAGPLRLDRKPLGLLTFLALEGVTPRARLLGLLWPESDEKKARVSLRQLLHRLRTASGEELVLGDQELSLAPQVQVDAVQLEADAFAGRHAEALRHAGVLLAPLDFSDCADMEAWVQRARAQLGALQQRAAGAEVDRLEREGQLDAALALTERVLEAAPLSEEAHRQVMRLYYLKGDRAAARGLYQRCVKMLREEYGAEPMPETQALARDVERGGVARSAAARPPGGRLPASVLRPPVLAGREADWARMERAWDAGQLIVLMGPPGVGKTRLAADFAATKGAAQVLDGRPGDLGVPFATLTRFVRRLLQGREHLPRELPAWAQREVARLLPELVPSADAPPAAADALPAGARLRFFEAIALLHDRMCAGLSAVVVDDMQFMDLATCEAGFFTLSRAFPMGHGERTWRYIDCVRTGELDAERWALLQRMVGAGQAVILELQPLAPAAVGELLAGLGLPGAERLAGELARYSGGNPLFITETVRHLVESGSLERGWPERLPPPGRVEGVVRQRLARLGLGAQQVAHVAALAGTAFDAGLAAEVLELSPEAARAAADELVAAQVLTPGGRFTHDLQAEAVRAAVPEVLVLLLHRRIATALHVRGAAPAVVAHHWLAGGELLRAAPALLEAARQAAGALRYAEAATAATQAASLWSASGRSIEAEAALEEARGFSARDAEDPTPFPLPPGEGQGEGTSPERSRVNDPAPPGREAG